MSESASRWRARPFPEGAPCDARTSIAVTLARRWSLSTLDHIPPGTWADAGAILKALRADGYAVRKVKP